MTEDQNLIERLRHGEEKAFESLYIAYGKKLYVFIFRYVGVAQEAEEILQETFLRILEDRGERISNLQAWLYTVARNLALNRIRSAKTAKRAAQHVEADEAPTEFFEVGDRQWVANEVQSLSTLQQRLFQLRVSGRSYDEMASDLGIPVGTVKSRMHEMLTTLKERWKTWNVEQSIQN